MNKTRKQTADSALVALAQLPTLQDVEAMTSVITPGMLDYMRERLACLDLEVANWEGAERVRTVLGCRAP